MTTRAESSPALDPIHHLGITTSKEGFQRCAKSWKIFGMSNPRNILEPVSALPKAFGGKHVLALCKICRADAGCQHVRPHHEGVCSVRFNTRAEYTVYVERGPVIRSAAENEICCPDANYLLFQ